MKTNYFFKKLDEAVEAKKELQQLSEAHKIQRFQEAKAFARRLQQTLAPYLKGFAQRGFGCKEKATNLPFYRVEIQQAHNSVELGICAYNDGYRFFAYCNNVERHLPIRIGQVYNEDEVHSQLQNLFSVFM